MAPSRLKIDTTAVLMVDVQEKLTPLIHEQERVVDSLGRLLDAAAALELPLLVTEQYRKGLGRTVPALSERIGRARGNHEKLQFSAWIDPIREHLHRLGARSVILAGLEAHVCVVQTALDLTEAGYVVAVAADAIGSRRPLDQQMAVQRMTQAGVLPTTVEAAVLELVHQAGGERFKSVLPMMKA